ncbi:type II toxin-antitoxin system ParD family antitoxin [Rhizobium sp. LC145]|uniref:type II toxin-antitoxin system ParD family antitoxin n=1 Tax=Rhizobium sp. LC145 TaxID=1120688 RepID=UPI000AC35229
MPDPMKEWIEAQVEKGEYASASDYVRDLVRRDRERRGREFTMDELRQLVANSRASGIGARSLDDLFAEAEHIAATREGIRE